MIKFLLEWLVIELAAAIALLIAILICLIKLMLRMKIATVPSMTLSLNATQFDHGEEVDASGIVYSDVGIPAANETVVLKLVDSAGALFDNLATAATGTDGSYKASFDIPAAAAPGQATVTAYDAKLDVQASQTITLNMSHKRWVQPKLSSSKL